MKRRWPLLAAGAAALLLIWLWTLSGQIRQMQFVYTYAAILIAGIGGIVRLLRTQRVSGRQWAFGLVFLLAFGVLFLSSVRYRGLTGDWIPILEWRWADRIDWTQRSLGTLSDLEGRNEPIDLAFPAAFSRFLGPNSNSTVSGLNLERDWDASPPQQVWRRHIGGGWAGFAIAGDVAYTLEQRDDKEFVVAYDLESGGEIWGHADKAYFSNVMGGTGPRTTPSVSQHAVFTLGATGLLNALDRTTGALLWQHNIIAENGARLPEHGTSGSPLLVDDLVVVHAGGSNERSVVAYRQGDGRFVWGGGEDRAGFASPVLAELAGVRQILVFNASSVAGHAIDDGRILWQYPWPASYPNVAPALAVGNDRVLFSTGYGVGAKMLRITRGTSGELSAQMLWESPRMKAKFTNLVYHAGSIYGLDDGVLVCLDPDTGKRRWKRGRYGHGNILLVDEVLMLQTEKGEMVMIDPDPSELRVLSHFMALPGKAWNHFALVDPYLLVRNDREAALWRLPIAER